ncbi:hypothetical protein Ocin01_13345, partial [Orchesella cincta]
LRSSSYSVNKVHPTPLGNPDPFLIIEKSLEVNGQPWVENVNLIEEFLVQIVRRLSKEYPQLRSTFVVRRLPNFMVPYTNKNEYAIVLDNFDFSIVPHDPSAKPTVDKIGKPNFGQIEVFLPRKYVDPTLPVNGYGDAEATGSKSETMEDCNVFLNSAKAYYSHEVFKAFATAFTKVSQTLNDGDTDDANATTNENGEQLLSQVQLIGPHLLKDLKCNVEVAKIFHLAHQNLRLSSSLKLKTKTTVNHLKSYISVVYGDTEVIIRPALYYEHGYHRVNANVTERIPLHHGGMLTIGESLLKGCLLIPTSFETLWTVQFWPAESHITSLYHPGSVIIRLFKMFGAFCINPLHFYETLNNNFMIGMEDLETLLPEDKSKLLPVDYFISSFLYELEDFPNIEDWAPRNFPTRFLHLLRTAIDCFDKGFHGHYFTKINVLRGLWRNSLDYCDREEKSALRELDDIRESPDTLEDYKDVRFLETDDLEDEFGLRFDDLDIDDGDESRYPPRLTSELVYRSSINPFDSLRSEGVEGAGKSSLRSGTKSLSKLLGSTFLKKLGGGGSKANSEAGTVRSIQEVASEFEKSIAQQRNRPSLLPFPMISEGESHEMHSRQNLYSAADAGPGPSSRSQQQYDNDAFEENVSSGNQVESIYSNILQSIKELPPSDSEMDPDVQEYMIKMKRILQSQEELIISWGKVISEFPKPKFICPHAFTTRQIQYLSRVIAVVSRCSPSTIKIIRSSKIPSWEISGDILRIVLHQMRSESNQGGDHLGRKGAPSPPKKSTSFSGRNLIPKRPTLLFKSFKRDASTDPCKLNEHDQRYSGDHVLSPEEEMQLALEEPETAATNRLLQWLWQLRTSEIGRLSLKANKYLEELYNVSMRNSHFLEQQAEEKAFETLALRSAVAVTKIMETGKFPAHIPLSTAAKKGWLWAEMVLSLASWNHDKGLRIKARIPLVQDDGSSGPKYLSKDINGTAIDMYDTTKKKNPLEPEPDLDAVTLAFHSELSTPIGWNDIEDPRQPGPFTIAVLIFSSLTYYKRWEVIPGNIVHALVRLQKFNTLQHVGNMLSHPHRKTALSEVRKLNKSTSFRIHHFENNIMSKTFKRLASIRTTKHKASKSTETPHPICLTCDQAGCSERNCGSSTIAVWNGREIECTKL